MSTSLDLATLRSQSRLFSLLNEAGQKKLLEGAEEVRFPAGHALMRENERGDDFFVILDGTVAVSIEDKGSQKQVATLTRGAFVGEIAALMGEARNATVLCESEVLALRFHAARVNEALKDYPRVREALVKLALKRSEDNLQRMLDISVPDAGAIADDEEG
jgi:CRP-like cAMP-binding protein